MLKTVSGNSAWAILEHLFYPLAVFATTPFFYHRIGVTQYGFWMLLIATTNFGAVLNVGTGAATIRYVSADIGKGATEGIKATLRGSLAIALIGGGCFALIILVVYSLAGDLLFSKMGDPGALRLTAFAAAFLAWIEQLDNVYASTLKGAERFGSAAKVEIATRAIQLAVAISAVAISGTLEALYLALILTALFRLVIKLHFVRITMHMGMLTPSLESAIKILHFSKWGWIQGAGAVLFGVADRWLVGALLGASSLAHYSIASQLASQVHAIAAAAISVTFPLVSRKREGNPLFSLVSDTRRTFAESLLFSGCIAAVLLLFGRQIVVLWIGPNEAEAVTTLVQYLAVAYWILALNVPPHFILLALGRVRFLALSNLIAGLASVFIIWLLIQRAGLEGVAVGRGIYGLLTCVSFIPLVRELRGERHGLSRQSASKN